MAKNSGLAETVTHIACGNGIISRVREHSCFHRSVVMPVALEQPPVKTKRATIDDLYGLEGKNELINGRIVRYMASGVLPSEVAMEIALDLRRHAKKIKKGRAWADGLGYH